MSRRHLGMLFGLVGDLGLVVHVHQDRRARHRAVHRPPRACRARDARAPRRRAPGGCPCARRRLRCVRSLVPLVVVGIANTALPVYLIFWAETRIDSGTTAVLQATAPLGHRALRFPVRPRRARTRPAPGRALSRSAPASGSSSGTLPNGSIVAGLAVVTSALCYAAAGLYAGVRLAGVHTLTVALGTLAVATLALLPAGVAQRPTETPGWKSIAAVVVLGTRRDGVRLPPLLRDPRRGRGESGDPHHVPRTADGARSTASSSSGRR